MSRATPSHPISTQSTSAWDANWLEQQLIDELYGPLQIRVVTKTASTNTDLLDQARKLKLQTPSTLLVAREQTAGRGRYGRPWISHAEHALTFSYGFLWAHSPLQLGGIPLIAGLSLQQAISAWRATQQITSGQTPCQLKWPNDVLYDERKLAGILVESVNLAEDQHYVVIGMGINLDLPAEVRLQIAQPVADLSEMLDLQHQSIALQTLAGTILTAVMQRLRENLHTFEMHGLSRFVKDWNAVHAYQDKAVQLLDQGQVLITGLARGIDEYGQFLLETAQGMHRVRSGELSLRAFSGAI